MGKSSIFKHIRNDHVNFCAMRGGLFTREYSRIINGLTGSLACLRGNDNPTTRLCDFYEERQPDEAICVSGALFITLPSVIEKRSVKITRKKKHPANHY